MDPLASTTRSFQVGSHPENTNEIATFLFGFQAFNLASHVSCRDRKTEEHYKLQDELVTTTEHTEHTEKEPDCRVSSFRVFSVFRGSPIGSCTD